ncbi:MAG: DeoR/GlpR transcriptional regulator [Lachnospiraceae bacterium]|jgi:DeoR/GlpR family transcriptional regulator of sugar metabolism|nr:DeoR/GlpR transcriptional regulator [Lachnospiraceae bacterium]
MFADERKIKIEEMLKRKPSVTTSELTELFQVSVETIRRDLEYLESQGRLRRVHGGAVAVGRLQNYTSLSGRVVEHRPEKREIALAACAYIQEGDYIALDTGSTALELAGVLGERFRELTVLTHSLETVKLLSERENIRTILAGGFYLPEEKCFCGHLTLDMIRQLHVSKCFIAPSAISLDFGIRDHMQELIAIQRAFLEISDQVYVLADSSKVGVCAPLKICEMSASYRYITDAGLPDEILETYVKAGFEVVRS